MKKITQFKSGSRAYEYIKANPGVCTAQVDRACRTARGGHQWMYATVNRLIRAGFVRAVNLREGCGRVALFALPVTECGARADGPMVV